MEELLGGLPIPASVRRFATAWNKRDWFDICAYLAAVIRDRSSSPITPTDIGEILALLSATPAHIRTGSWASLLSYMVRLRHPHQCRRPSVRMLPSSSDKALWAEYTSELGVGVYDVSRYDVMRERVLYGVRPAHLQSFYLARHSRPPGTKIDYMWSCYAAHFARDTPYWRDRLDACGFIPTSSPPPAGEHVCFSTDEGDEAFHDDYWIHPDEQPHFVRQLCLPDTTNVMEEAVASAPWLRDVLEGRYWTEGAITTSALMSWVGAKRMYMYQN